MLTLSLAHVAVLITLAQPVATVADQPQDPNAERIAAAHAASRTLIEAIESVEGNLGVKTARSHDGNELILAWFEDREAVLRWFNHSYHRKLLRDAGRPEDGVAAEHFGNKVGPILVLASVAYNAQPVSLDGSMFDDPFGRRPARFAIEYYIPLPGGAYMESPFAPGKAASRVEKMRDVYED